MSHWEPGEYQTSLRRAPPLSIPPITHIWELNAREVWLLRAAHWAAAVDRVQVMPLVEYQTSLRRIEDASSPPITHIWLLNTREVGSSRAAYWAAVVDWVQVMPLVEYQTSF